MRVLRSAKAAQTNSADGTAVRGASSRASRIIWSLAIALVFLYPRFFLLPATPFAGSGDEFLFFSRALRLLHGQVLYRDVFEIAGPGTEALYALGFYVFGQRAWVIEAWHVALGCALCMAMTSISEQIFEGMVVYLPAMIFLVFDFSGASDATHHWYSTLAVLCAVSVLMRGSQAYHIAFAGLLCGVAVLFTQTQGGMATIALGLYLVLTKQKSDAIAGSAKKLVIFLAPGVLLVAGCFGYYASRAGVHTLFYDLAVFPLTGLSGPINSPNVYFHQFPRIHGAVDLLQAMPFFVIVALVPYVYLIALYQCWKKPATEEKRQQLLLLCAAGLALFIAVCSGPTYFRLSTVAAPAIVCGVWLIEQSSYARAVRVSVFCATLIFFAWLPAHRQVQRHYALSLPAGEVAFIDRGSYELMQHMKERTRPADGFFNDDMVAFYLELRNPTRAEFVNNDAFTSPRDVSEVIAAIQKDPPRYIAMFPGVPETPFDHAEPFRTYVHLNYCLVQTFVITPRRFAEEIWGSCDSSGGIGVG